MDCTCIVCCDSLESHLEAGQKMGTTYPIYTLDRALHSEPKNMRQSILEKLVSGQWDEQFLIVPPGTVLTKSASSLGEEFQYG